MKVELDKSESRTDWLARPLTERQCVYAAADVFYLLPMAKQLVQETEEAGWTAAANNECLLLCQRRSGRWRRHWPTVKSATRQLRPRQLGCLQKLAEWRLRRARERDLAVNFVVREENLWQVARYMPSSLGELDSLGLSGPEIRYHGKRCWRWWRKPKRWKNPSCRRRWLTLSISRATRRCSKTSRRRLLPSASKAG